MKEIRLNKRNFRKERRGVGAIIGGVLLVAILLTTVLLYFITILNNDERKALYDVQSSQIDQNKAAENLSATSLQLETNPGGETGLFLKTLIANEGSLPLIVSHSAAYCITCASPNNPSPGLNNTAVPLNIRDSATRYVPVSVDNNYTAGFITERGNIFYSENCKIVTATEMVCTDSGTESTGPFFEISVSQDTFFLEAGQSGEESIINVTSRNDFNENVNVSVDAETGITAVLNPVTPTVTPLPGESVEAATLTIGTLEDISEGNYLVTVNGVNDDGSISDSETITIVIFDPTSNGEDGEEGKEDDSILKPQIQGVFPNPYGETASDSTKKGLWGVVVANAADFDMTVRRVVVTAFTPYGSNPTIFPSNGGSPYCPVTNVLPASGGTWSCPARNTLVWSGTFIVPAHTSQEFFAAVGQPSSNDDFPSYSINFNVFTTFGQYAKAGYSGSMTKTASEIANVYLSTTTASSATSSMIGKLTVEETQTTKVNATIAHLGDVGQINAGTKLIVLIHKAFTDVALTANPPTGFSSCTNLPLGDGSTQITCELDTALTAGQARTIQFTMEAPTLSGTDAKLYPLLVLADGADGNAAPMGAVGPVAEAVVRVTPS
jgi:hypothetical protein